MPGQGRADTSRTQRRVLRVRIAAAIALAAAIAVLAVVLLGGGGYHVTGTFTNASQLVKGDVVTVAGNNVGKVTSIDLTRDGLAHIGMDIESDYAPLRQGTRAIVREDSLSGVANRYVSLQLGGANRPPIPDGGNIPRVDTTSSVDLDELFDIFTPKVRTATKRVIRLFRDAGYGREAQEGEALRYLSPALASSARLLAEIDRSRPALERFIVSDSGLVTDVSANEDALAGLISHLDTTLQALDERRGPLALAVDRLPRFLRRANTTFVNLRTTLDALDPLVADAKPVVRHDLRPLLHQLRPLAIASVPTVRDLSQTVRKPGPDNDLVELLDAQPALNQIATKTARRDGADRPGALPELRRAVNGLTPDVAFFRPYTVDLVGWFDDFSTSGLYDALGNFSRAGIELNSFSTGVGNTLIPVPAALRPDALAVNLAIGRNQRCPGSEERTAPDGSNPYIPYPGFHCDPSERPIGP